MSNNNIVEKPWTDEQTSWLEEFQSNNEVHGYTCPNMDVNCANHRKLIPTNNGWICGCGRYIQNWVSENALKIGEKLWQKKRERL